MSLQIRKLVLYHSSGRLREIEFRLGALNIVTGASKTGKSAIIDIVDYCMGRTECFIAEGIQRHVAWFGILLEDAGTHTFVARRSPAGVSRSSSDVYFQQGVSGEPPTLGSLAKNSTVDAVRSRLSRIVGIRENRHVSRPNQTRVPLEANIRHALFLCMQDQNDIDSRAHLFHRQSDPFIAVDIRHTLPYFLGAIDEDRLLRQAQLEGARRELRRLERLLQIATSTDSVELPRARALLAESAQVGLIGSAESAESPESVVNLLRSIPVGTALGTAEVFGSGDEQLESLRNDRQDLRAELNRIRAAIGDVRLANLDRSKFEMEAIEQRARLSSIGLLQQSNGTASVCPLCTSELTVPVPGAREIRASLERLNQQLQSAQAEVPRSDAQLSALLAQEQRLVEQLRSNHEQIQSLIKVNDLLSSQQNQAILQAHVAGKVAMYLDTIAPTEAESDLEHKLDDICRTVERLEKELDPDIVQENVDTFLNFISDYVTEYARTLNLEYSDNRIRLDLRRLTIIADTIDGAVSLDRMGSAENWVGYHIASHLALHRWFRTKNCPVPGFLILDQPSQAHFPPDLDAEGSIEYLDNEDRTAVERLYRLIAGVASLLSPELQVIVLDHARIEEEWFTDAIVEEWRSTTGAKLVPDNWIPNQEREV